MRDLSQIMTWDTWLYVFCNMAILAVYFLIALIVVPVMEQYDLFTKCAAMVFCCATGANYVDMTLRTFLTPDDPWISTVHHPHVIVIRVVQAVALVAFIIGFTKSRTKQLHLEQEQVRKSLEEAKGIVESIDRVGG